MRNFKNRLTDVMTVKNAENFSTKALALERKKMEKKAHLNEEFANQRKKAH